jgi:A118 family predicted phage portal protein
MARHYEGGELMPLPQENSKVIPPQWREIYDLYEEHAAWYSGDPNRITRVYSYRVSGLGANGKMWAQNLVNERRTMVHVPLAGDISALSASLMFGEAPKVKISEAFDPNTPNERARVAQNRIDEIIAATDVISRLLEGAETCSALGGVFLKVDFMTGYPYPLLSVAQADCALPEFAHGILSAVTFFMELPNPNEDHTVYRLVERHEVNDRGKAVVMYGLYAGNEESFGQRLPLTSRVDTADLPDSFTYEGIDGLAVRYIPNIRPHRRFRGQNIGRSDYDGLEGLFDALDEVYSSWMRDIRLAKARIIVPEEWLKKDAKTGNLYFDADEEVFTALDIDPMNQQNGVQAEQFAIRAQEHAQTAMDLIRQIVTMAGYSPQDFGLDIEGQAESGTALNVRRQKSLSTQAKKAGYWKSALEDIFHMMMIIDATVLGNDTPTEFRPSVDMQDGAIIDMNQIADALSKLYQAQAVSIETAVAIAHPDWEQDQVKAEANKILSERGLTMQESPELELT